MGKGISNAKGNIDAHKKMEKDISNAKRNINANKQWEKEMSNVKEVTLLIRKEGRI
ncbi:hypothetical protein H9655_17835 [Cytobacillus sp. Sa5YUA1]|uniref:Uncharacterized protein n=1 Tax=Cytobacillus stercorigallinarum TaxID=2762240 RepID=A0ABR8QTN2_9BACI|nr:hypothetical protein [Cytobacillus stercorigallinarum]MBD7938899.1 hypothetical protein [Cytobacillus stercorigallinarum]